MQSGVFYILKSNRSLDGKKVFSANAIFAFHIISYLKCVMSALFLGSY